MPLTPLPDASSFLSFNVSPNMSSNTSSHNPPSLPKHDSPKCAIPRCSATSDLSLSSDDEVAIMAAPTPTADGYATIDMSNSHELPCISAGKLNVQIFQQLIQASKSWLRRHKEDRHVPQEDGQSFVHYAESVIEENALLTGRPAHLPDSIICHCLEGGMASHLCTALASNDECAKNTTALGYKIMSSSADATKGESLGA
ncbi:hypothetical protein VNI00_014400 [Paramarasmius palmivorus]|uniref:Uncharacterized protein n=1 Tax=Paramarasmius palmivorus TaxID=297713 RepID=A0AAW0BTX0_9AGAR